MAILVVMAVTIGFFGCSQQKAEAPKQDFVTKKLIPAKASVKGPNFAMELTDLEVDMTVNTASNEIVDTPRLTGHYKVINTSNDLLEVEGVTLDYINADGKPIPFKSGDKKAAISLGTNNLRPGESSEGTLDATIPRAAVKELEKIDVNLVYVPLPVKHETITLQEKVG